MRVPLRSLAQVAAVVAVVGLALWTHRKTLDYGLLGWDAYPLIISSRILTPADFTGTFTEVMMDGRYAQGSFYRPVHNLILAAEYAVWGLDPRGYHFTALAAFAITIVLVFLTTRRLLRNHDWIAPALAASFVALHPAMLTVLPVPARRVELFVVVFLLAAVMCLPDAASNRRGRPLLAALFVLLAAGCKETGVVGLAVVLLHQLLMRETPARCGDTGRGIAGPPTGAWSVLIRTTTRAAWPSATAVLVYVAARTLVIGGLGGHGTSSLATWGGHVLEFAPRFLAATLCPWSPAAGWSTELLSAAAGAVLVLTCLAALLTSHGGGRAALFGLGWIVIFVAFMGIAGRFSPWYAVPCVVGVGMALAGMCEAAREFLTAQTAWKRGGGAAIAIGAALVFVIAMAASPLIHNYAEWDNASARQRTFLSDLGAQIASAPDGVRVDVYSMPRMLSRPDSGGPRLSGVAVLAPYSVQAWAELSFADRRVRVVGGDGGARIPPPARDELLVVVWERSPPAGRSRPRTESP
ncbi:MAG: hypothetical protein HUU22_11130 [Phycisphaerae bacterium]|nr:hypothetical protein [Phycisphaerae bacterium]NUQ46574.1 hypothetical protein [Phycisphaerae bacterium]